MIDESLDPDANPAKEGRYRYTTGARRRGHWRLHRHLFASGPARTSLFDGDAAIVICRSSRAKAPIELQADFYASCLLMPRKLVFAAWDEMFPDRKQRVLQPRTPIEHRYVEITQARRFFAGASSPKKTILLSIRFAKPFAEKFLVSPVAMRIRLEKLGLLHRVVPGQRLLKA